MVALVVVFSIYYLELERESLLGLFYRGRLILEGTGVRRGRVVDMWLGRDLN